MPLQVAAIMLGVKDLARAKKFYGEGLGCKIDQDHPTFVSFNLGDGSSSLALYPWEAAAQDAGVPPQGIWIPGCLVPLHRAVEGGGGRDHEQGRGGGRQCRERACERSVGLLRVLQRPGRLPLEGRRFGLGC